MIESQKVKYSRWSREHTPESKLLQDQSKLFWRENSFVPSSEQYNLSICDAPRFVWFRNAKVGTRTVFSAFNKAGIELTADSLFNCYYFPREYSDYFKFAFVRNPWDRFVSGWLNKIVHKNAFNLDVPTLERLRHFDTFVGYCSEQNLKTWNAHFRHQSKLIDLNEIDYLGRLERFEDDLKEIFTTLGISLKKVPIANRSPHRKHYSSYYTDETRDTVGRLYRNDIQLFGYTFDDRRS